MPSNRLMEKALKEWKMVQNNAKKIYYTILTAITVAGFITVCTLGQSVRRHKLETKLTAALEQNLPKYLIREESGRAAVFRNGSEEPYLLLDVDMALLSDYDRALLGDGIYFSSESELRQYIEDISS